MQGYSWCLSSTSTTLIIEIAEDQAIDRETLPLVVMAVVVGFMSSH
ncbi:hypothetical protein [Photobacterium kishitanii]|nr:hypothetical protein [Photobacterium kishitanii]